MKIFQALRSAYLGWLALLKNQPAGLDHFELSFAGLVKALVLFYAAVFLAVMLWSMQTGVPTGGQFVEIVFVQTMWLAALVIGIFSTRFVARSSALKLDMIVPAIYALIFYLLLGTIVTVITTAIMPLLWLGLAFMLYRLGRIASVFSRGVSAAFAILTVVLLVGLPQTLYMLSASTLPAA